MNEENLDPQSELQNSPETNGLPHPDARRLSRLFAQILDGIILMFASIPVMIVFEVGAELDWDLVVDTGVFPIEQMLEFTAVGIIVYLLVNGYHLWYFGQTLGKKMMQIAIVDRQDKVPPFAKIIGLRYIPFQLVGAIPGLALISIVDIFMIFRADRRCLHDMVAGTRVIDVSDVNKSATD